MQPIRETLEQRRDVIVGLWQQAIADGRPGAPGEAGESLAHLLEQLITSLCADLFDPAQAREVGAMLADIGGVRPEVLGQAQEILLRQLIELLSPDQLLALRARLAALVGNLAVGFLAHALQSTRAEVDGGEQARLHALAEERTVELIRAIEYLEQEITERRRVEASLRQRNRELDMLHRATQTLISTRDLDQVLVIVLEEVRRMLGVAACSVWLFEPKSGELVCRQATGPRSEIVRGWRLQPGEGIAGWVATKGESLVVPDVWQDERHFKGVDQRTGLQLRSILSLPLRVGEHVIGTLQVTDTAVGRFNPADVVSLEPLAASAAIAIDNARLVEELRCRTVELNAFAGDVAHELKNPITLIMGLAEGLLENIPALSADELAHYLRTIARNGRRVKEIIQALLLLAGVDEEEIEPQPLDMGNIVSEALQRLPHLIAEYQAEIQVPEAWPVALGYGPWIEEVWANYISNAIKYGGRPPRVELGFDELQNERMDEWTNGRMGEWTNGRMGERANGRMEAESPARSFVDSPIRKFADSPTRFIRFWVRDNGAGLTSEQCASLFIPFKRLDTKRAEGHGLGLAIARRIIEKLGGQVWVESELGRGSCFGFTLPAAPIHGGTGNGE